MSKLNIENKTTWNTKDLEKIFLVCSEKYGYYPHKIIIYYHHSWRTEVYGWGTIGHGYVKIGLRNTKETYDKNSKTRKRQKLTVLKDDVVVRIAQVYIHEMGHNLRLKHDTMIKSRNINVDYVKGLEVRRNEHSKQTKNRIKLKDFKYGDCKAKIYKYPGRWYSYSKNKVTSYKYKYSYLIYRNNTLMFRKKPTFYENIKNVHDEIKYHINRLKK